MTPGRAVGRRGGERLQGKTTICPTHGGDALMGVDALIQLRAKSRLQPAYRTQPDGLSCGWRGGPELGLVRADGFAQALDQTGAELGAVDADQVEGFGGCAAVVGKHGQEDMRLA